QCEFGQPLASLHLAAQDELAQLQKRSDVLRGGRVHLLVFWRFLICRLYTIIGDVNQETGLNARSGLRSQCNCMHAHLSALGQTWARCLHTRMKNPAMRPDFVGTPSARRVRSTS